MMQAVASKEALCPADAGAVYASLVSTMTDDVGEQAELLGSVNRSYYQTGHGAFQGTYDNFSLPHIDYCREWQSQPMLRCVKMPADLCTIFMPRSRMESMRVDVHELGVDCLGYQPRGGDFDLHSVAGSEVVYLAIDQRSFEAAAMTLDPEIWTGRVDQPLMLRVTDPARIVQMIDGAIAAAPQWLASGVGERWASDLSQATLSALLNEVGQASDACCAKGRAELGRLHAQRLARRARAIIDEALHRRLTVLDLCHELGVSRRTLQDVFQRVLNMSPVAYLRMVRLHRARRELRRPVSVQASVGAIAARWGFMHPSQFSIDYQRMFGELPSHTLKKALRQYQ